MTRITSCLFSRFQIAHAVSKSKTINVIFFFFFVLIYKKRDRAIYFFWGYNNKETHTYRNNKWFENLIDSSQCSIHFGYCLTTTATANPWNLLMNSFSKMNVIKWKYVHELEDKLNQKRKRPQTAETFVY